MKVLELVRRTISRCGHFGLGRTIMGFACVTSLLLAVSSCGGGGSGGGASASASGATGPNAVLAAGQDLRIGGDSILKVDLRELPDPNGLFSFLRLGESLRDDNVTPWVSNDRSFIPTALTPYRNYPIRKLTRDSSCDFKQAYWVGWFPPCTPRPDLISYDDSTFGTWNQLFGKSQDHRDAQDTSGRSLYCLATYFNELNGTGGSSYYKDQYDYIDCMGRGSSIGSLVKQGKLPTLAQMKNLVQYANGSMNLGVTTGADKVFSSVEEIAAIGRMNPNMHPLVNFARELNELDLQIKKAPLDLPSADQLINLARLQNRRGVSQLHQIAALARFYHQGGVNFYPDTGGEGYQPAIKQTAKALNEMQLANFVRVSNIANLVNVLRMADDGRVSIFNPNAGFTSSDVSGIDITGRALMTMLNSIYSDQNFFTHATSKYNMTSILLAKLIYDRGVSKDSEYIPDPVSYLDAANSTFTFGQLFDSGFYESKVAPTLKEFQQYLRRGARAEGPLTANDLLYFAQKFSYKMDSSYVPKGVPTLTDRTKAVVVIDNVMALTRISQAPGVPTTVRFVASMESAPLTNFFWNYTDVSSAKSSSSSVRDVRVAAGSAGDQDGFYNISLDTDSLVSNCGTTCVSKDGFLFVSANLVANSAKKGMLPPPLADGWKTVSVKTGGTNNPVISVSPSNKNFYKLDFVAPQTPDNYYSGSPLFDWRGYRANPLDAPNLVYSFNVDFGFAKGASVANVIMTFDGEGFSSFDHPHKDGPDPTPAIASESNRGGNNPITIDLRNQANSASLVVNMQPSFRDIDHVFTARVVDNLGRVSKTVYHTFRFEVGFSRFVEEVRCALPMSLGRWRVFCQPRREAIYGQKYNPDLPIHMGTLLGATWRPADEPANRITYPEDAERVSKVMAELHLDVNTWGWVRAFKVWDVERAN